MSEWISCGRFGRPHGVHGAIRLWCHNPQTDLLKPTVQIKVGVSPSDLKVYTIVHVRKDAKSHIVSLKEIRSRQDTTQLTHQEWFTQRNAFDHLDDDEIYLVDLIGMEGKLDDGRSLGKVKDILNTGASDILIFQGDLGEVMVPYVELFIAEVNLETQSIVVNLVDGLLEGGL
jgi:16S rRNA processing protein RimM